MYLYLFIGSADEDREDGQHLAPFDEEDEEEDEEDDEEEEEQPEFDREELIERYHVSIESFCENISLLVSDQ